MPAPAPPWPAASQPVAPPPIPTPPPPVTPVPPAPPAPPVPPAPQPRRRARVLVVAAVLAALVAAGVAAALLLGGGDEQLVQRFATEQVGNGQCRAEFRFADGWQDVVDNVAIVADGDVVAAGAPDFEGAFLYDERLDLDAMLLEDARGDVVETAVPDPDDC